MIPENLVHLFTEKVLILWVLIEIKKSITFSLKGNTGKEIFKELLKKSGIVTENYRPNTMGKLGLGMKH